MEPPGGNLSALAIRNNSLTLEMAEHLHYLRSGSWEVFSVKDWKESTLGLFMSQQVYSWLFLELTLLPQINDVFGELMKQTLLFHVQRPVVCCCLLEPEAPERLSSSWVTSHHHCNKLCETKRLPFQIFAI